MVTSAHTHTQAFAMHPGSPRAPWSHPMQGVGWWFPVNELPATPTPSPGRLRWSCIHTNNTCDSAHELLLCDTECAVCGYTHILCDTGDSDVTVCTECVVSSPPKHSLDLVSWSDLPVCTKRLYQRAFVFWPAVLGPPPFSFGSLRIDRSCDRHMRMYMGDSASHG